MHHLRLLSLSGVNYPKPTDQSIQTNGHNKDQSLCNGFDSQGNARGVSTSIVGNVDYGKNELAFTSRHSHSGFLLTAPSLSR